MELRKKYPDRLEGEYHLMRKRYTEREIRRANIIYHTKLADTYNKKQPCYKPENISRVRKNIEEWPGNYLLDIGCGTGFIIDIANKYFDYCIGLDITKAMLKKIDLSSGNVMIQLADCSKLPFRNEVFDVCTAYGFLHHLLSLKQTFKEVSRCLKKGGIFYADQDPNYYFWEEIKNLKNDDYSDILTKEIASIQNVCNKLKDEFDLDPKITSLAEYQKIARGGMKEEVITRLLTEVGFSTIKFEYQWFLGEAHVIHNISPKFAELIEKHLKECLPVSKNLFKYFSFVAIK
jgi:ubiquinone/menaquinone biosynthesis C-methylase UbiE